MENDADQIEDIFLLGEDLQEKINTSGTVKMSLSGSLNLSTKLEKIETLKKSLTDDLSQQLLELDSSLKKWNNFTATQGQFETWLVDVEVRMNEISSADIQLDTPDKLKVNFGRYLYFKKMGFLMDC